MASARFTSGAVGRAASRVERRSISTPEKVLSVGLAWGSVFSYTWQKYNYSTDVRAVVLVRSSPPPEMMKAPRSVLSRELYPHQPARTEWHTHTTTSPWWMVSPGSPDGLPQAPLLRFVPCENEKTGPLHCSRS